jgi:hypothetical protein
MDCKQKNKMESEGLVDAEEVHAGIIDEECANREEAIATDPKGVCIGILGLNFTV